MSNEGVSSLLALPTASVIIPAYTLDRWDLLSDAVSSVEAQTRPPIELILCIDHNPDLFQRCCERWAIEMDGRFPIRVISNRFHQESGGTEAHERAARFASAIRGWVGSQYWC